MNKGLKFPKFDRKIVKYGVTTKYILTMKNSDKEFFQNLEPLFNDLNRVIDDNFVYIKHEVPTQFVGMSVCNTSYDEYDEKTGIKIAKAKAYEKAEEWFNAYIARVLQLDKKFHFNLNAQLNKRLDDKYNS